MASKSCANSGVSAALTRTMISLRQRSTIFYCIFDQQPRRVLFIGRYGVLQIQNMMASAPKKAAACHHFRVISGYKEHGTSHAVPPSARASAASSRARRIQSSAPWSSTAISPCCTSAARRTLRTVCSIAAPNCKRTVDVIRSFSVSAGRTVTSTSADSAAPAEASFRITTKIPPCMFFNISCCLQQIFLDKSRLYPLY